MDDGELNRALLQLVIVLVGLIVGRALQSPPPPPPEDHHH